MPKGHYLAEAVKDAIWVLRVEGVSEAEIARRLAWGRSGRGAGSCSRISSPEAVSSGAECCLACLAEREEISRGTALGESARAIGRTLGRSHTTVAREMNRCVRGRYRAHAAGQTAWGRARRPRGSKLESLSSELRELAIPLLEPLDHGSRTRDSSASTLAGAWPDPRQSAQPRERDSADGHRNG